MTPEQNVQTAQAGYAAFGRGDMQGVLAVLDPGIEWKAWDPSAGGAACTKKGHSGVLEFFGAIADNWDFEAFEPREFIATGDRVAVVGYYKAKAKKTGKTLGTEWLMLWKFKDGKCTHFQEFTDSAALQNALK